MKKYLIIPLLVLLLLLNHNSSKLDAFTNGKGTLTWNFDENFPPTFVAWESSNPVGYLSYRDTITGYYSYPTGDKWGDYGGMFIEEVPYSYDDNKFNASIQTVKPFENFFEFEVFSPDPGQIEAHVGSDLGQTVGRFKFLNEESFPQISYSYEFYGATDSTPQGGFSLQFYHQMYVVYWDGVKEHYFYSNYCNPINPPPYCSEFPLFRLNGSGNIHESDEVVIGPFSLPEGVYRENGWWEIRFDFSGGGWDLSGKASEEPSIEETIDFFGKATENGTIEASAGGALGLFQLFAMRAYLSSVSYCIDRGWLNLACSELRFTYFGCDGSGRDLVKGEDAEELNQMIYEVGVSLNCRWTAD